MPTWIPPEKKVTISDLIMEYTEDGYDVTITVGGTADGSPGQLSVPTSWAVRLGMDLQKSNESR